MPKAKRDWRLRFFDMQECMRRIQSYTGGHTFESFSADRMRIDAVLRNLEVIGEASSHVPPEVASLHAELPWIEMRAMRNFLAHEYFGISLAIVWRTATARVAEIGPIIDRIVVSFPDKKTLEPGL